VIWLPCSPATRCHLAQNQEYRENDWSAQDQADNFANATFNLLWCSFLLSNSVPGEHFRPIQECNNSTIFLVALLHRNPYNGMYQSKSTFHFTTKHTIIPVVDSTCCFF
jgi:hypothetical protein